MATRRPAARLVVGRAAPPPTPADQAERLTQRLSDGWERIESAISRDEDVVAWESFWIDLLHQYEQVCDEGGLLLP